MERFNTVLKDENPQLYYEHIHRYLLAKENISGGLVLDMACGTGYGTKILSEIAERIVGVDISSEAIKEAQEANSRDNTEFKKADCCATGLPSQTFDYITSFETIEHLDSPLKLIEEITRLLKDDGVLIISSPDKFEYTDKRHVKNPHHKKELYHSEFRSLLEKFFPHCLIAKQRLVAGSAVVSDDGFSSNSVDNGLFYGDHKGNGYTNKLNEGVYSVAFCSRVPLKKIRVGIYENKLDSAVVWNAREEILPAKRQISELKSQIDTLKESSLKRKSEVANFEKHLQQNSNSLKSGLEEIIKRSERAEEQFNSLQTDIEKQRSCLESYREENANLTNQNTSLQSDLREKGLKIETLEEECDRVREELKASQKSLEQKNKENDSLLKVIDNIEDQNAEAQVILSTKLKLIAELENKQHSLFKESELKEKELDDLHTRLNQCSDERDNLSERYQHLKQTFSWKSTVPLRAIRRFFERLTG
ncbi:Methyltransferase domain family [Verrucomicrobiia bacterium DG1235]|nr:Methyltransferase domain family [Verrucomicrobiae bacterium DG1235]